MIEPEENGRLLAAAVDEALDHLAVHGLGSSSLWALASDIVDGVHGTPDERRAFVARLVALWVAFAELAGKPRAEELSLALETCMTEAVEMRAALGRVEPWTFNPVDWGWLKRELRENLQDDAKPPLQRSARFARHAREVAGLCLQPAISPESGLWAHSELAPVAERARLRLSAPDEDLLRPALTASQPGECLLRALGAARRLKEAETLVSEEQHGWWLLVAGGATDLRVRHRQDLVRRGLRQSAEPQQLTTAVIDVSGASPSAPGKLTVRWEDSDLDIAVHALARSGLRERPELFAAQDALAHVQRGLEVAGCCWLDGLIENTDQGLGGIEVAAALTLIGAWATTPGVGDRLRSDMT